MKVRDRLLLTFFLVVGVLLLPSLFAVLRLDDMRRLAVEGRARHAEAVVALGRTQTAVSEADRYLRSYVATPSPALAGSVEDRLRSLEAAAGRLRAAGYEAEGVELGREIEVLADSTRRILELVDAGRMADATDRVLALGGRVAEVAGRIDRVASTVDEEAAMDFRAADRIAASARDTVLLAIFLCMGLAAALAAWTTRGLSRPLEALRGAMGRVADAEEFATPADLPYERRDEIGALADSFRTMTQRLEELDRLKVEFMGVAGHELKTPINVIRGYAELIEEEMETDLTGHQAEILHRIAEQTEVMSRMVSRLMDISRLEAGSLGLEPEPVLVEDLLLGLERRFEILAREKGVELEVSRAGKVPERVVVDVDLVRDEVLGNLVSNALRFTPEGGRVEVTGTGGGGGLTVRVSDTGPGIPEEHRPHIFERYYRAERSRGLGTGLGLAICSQVAREHGGWVRLVEDGAPGATFEVFLPAGP